jgi:protein Tob/BTG
MLLLLLASVQASVQPSTIHLHLPRDFVLWIDPFSVSYRVGDHGNIMTLFEDRSRGRITLKMDPNPTNVQQPATPVSPSGSPMMQYLQPRTTTPIRISPPNSPESTLLKNNGNNNHTSSPLSKKDQKQQKGLVLAN